jgi:hypothetical protein
MLAYTNEKDERSMERLVSEDLARSVALGKKRLADNDMDANDAVFLFDGRIPVGDAKLDAVIVEIRAYFSPKSEAVLALPYTPESAGGFRVHKPKLLAWTNCEDFDMNAALTAFFQGVDAHEQGSKIWSERLDESK